MSLQKPLSVAVVGCGAAAHSHLRALRNLEKKGWAVLKGVMDTQPDQAKRLLVEAQRGYFKDRPIYTDLSQLMSEQKPDLLAVVTPPAYHVPLALELLPQSHLLIEKPVALNSDAVLPLMEKVRESDKKVALGYGYRYYPGVAQLQKRLCSGAYGSILYGSITLRWGHDDLYYRTAPWRGERKVGGGVVMNQSIHALDLMAWLMNVTEPIQVESLFSNRRHDTPAEDTAFGLFRFENGVVLNYEGTTASLPHHHEASLYIACEKAEIRAGVNQGKFYFSIDAPEETGEKKRLLKEMFRELFGGWYRPDHVSGFRRLKSAHTSIYLDLIRAIQENREPLANLEAGYQSLRWVEALYQASTGEAN